MKPLRADHPPKPPVPHPVSGIIDCPAELSWHELVEAALRNGWSVDGLQPEAPEATVGELLERRQPRPVAWACGLLPERCCRLVAEKKGAGAEPRGYTSIRAPRKASGPDWAYFFIGCEGRYGRVAEASIALVRPSESYLLVEAAFDGPEALFEASRRLVRLAPFSTRRLEWSERRLVAAVPAQPGLAGLLREQLSALGGRLERTTGVPESLLFSTAFEHSGPRLVVSGTYDCVAETVLAVEQAGGGEGVAIALSYADAHGIEATVAVDAADVACLDSAWAELMRRGAELHDARRCDTEGTWQWLASTIELWGEQP